VENFIANKQVRGKLPRRRLYTSIRTRHIQLNDAYMRRSAPCAFEQYDAYSNKGVKETNNAIRFTLVVLNLFLAHGPSFKKDRWTTLHM